MKTILSYLGVLITGIIGGVAAVGILNVADEEFSRFLYREGKFKETIMNELDKIS